MNRFVPALLASLLGLVGALSVSDAAAAPQRIAVLPLDNKADLTNEETVYLTDMVRSVARRSLPKTQFLIMTQENFEVLLGPGKSLADCIGECAVETGKNLKAHYVVTGSVIRFGSSGSLRMSLKAHATRTGNPLIQIQVPGETVEAFEAAVAQKAPALFTAILNDVGGGRGVVKAKSTTQIYLTVTPPSARVTLNGRPLAGQGAKAVQGGLLIPVDPGTHKLTAEADGHDQRTQTVSVIKGRIVRVLVDLPPTQTAAPACAGEDCLADLEVRSTPPNADIWIDGVKQTEITSPSLNDPNVGAAGLRVPAGRRIIEVRMAQHEPAKTTIELSPGDLKKTPLLTLVPNFGALVIRSRPSQAVVRLNGVLQAERTPLTVPKLEAGPHNVELELANHHLLQETIFVGRGGTTERTLKLRPNFGTVALRVEHEGAPLDDVVVHLLGHGQTKTVAGVARFDGVPSGPRGVRVRDPLYGARSMELEVRDGETTAQTVTLEARYTELTVQIAGDVPGTLTVAGRPIKAGVKTKLPAGQAQARFAPANGDHYHPVAETWALSIGGDVVKTITPKARKGQLTVVTKPTGAQVFIDGVDKGAAPVRMEVFAGQHTVRVVATGYGSAEQTVWVDEGAKKRHAIALGQKPTLVLRCSHPEGLVELDGLSKGKAPQTVITTEGSHEVVCHAEGARSSQRVEVADRELKEVNLVITEAQLATARDARYHAQRKSGWTMTAVGGGLVIASGVSALMASAKFSDAEGRFDDAERTTSLEQADSAISAGQDLDAEGNTLVTTATVLGVAGAVTIGYGTYLLLTAISPQTKGGAKLDQGAARGWRLTPTALEYTW